MLNGHQIEEAKQENINEHAQNENHDIVAPVEEAKQDGQPNPIPIVLEDHNDDPVNIHNQNEEMQDEVLNLLMSSAQDLDHEINARQKKSDRRSVASPCVSRDVFKVAKKVGIPVSFD